MYRFGGGIAFDWIQPKHDDKVDYDETFRFHCQIRPFKGIYKKHQEANTKPPLHFHRYQYEYLEVIGKGDITVEVEGVEHRYTKNDPVALIPPYAHHVIYGTPGVVQEEIEFIVSSVDTRKGDGLTNRQLDRLFFENWYGYQEDVFRAGGNKFDQIQVLSVSTYEDSSSCLFSSWYQMFDAGDTYVTLPWWIPFRRTVAIGLGIAVGRWIGGFLGYQPFHPEWSTDWDVACASMEKVWSQRRFAKRDMRAKCKDRFVNNGVLDPNF